MLFALVVMMAGVLLLTIVVNTAGSRRAETVATRPAATAVREIGQRGHSAGETAATRVRTVALMPVAGAATGAGVMVAVAAETSESGWSGNTILASPKQ